MANVKEPLVLFLIGMRINTFWRVWEWFPAFLAMPQMIIELYKNPELGFLSARTEMAGRTITVIQYWKSFEALEAYASMSDRKHRPAWTAFYKRATSGTGAVGIFHETYVVRPGRHACRLWSRRRRGHATSDTPNRERAAAKRVGAPGFIDAGFEIHQPLRTSATRRDRA
jgi:hypothetical protein